MATRSCIDFGLPGEHGFSSSELDDYLSSESKYFKMFIPFMHLLSRFERLGNVTVASETYAYEVDSDASVSHMEITRLRTPGGRTQDPDVSLVL